MCGVNYESEKQIVDVEIIVKQYKYGEQYKCVEEITKVWSKF